tara:strand:- start:17 stop:190 length:174 start_codon:yes stop_codon:yes gene_type:complete
MSLELPWGASAVEMAVQAVDWAAEMAAGEAEAAMAEGMEAGRLVVVERAAEEVAVGD